MGREGAAHVRSSGNQGWWVQWSCGPPCTMLSAWLALPPSPFPHAQVISVDLPNTVELVVESTEPGVKGNTASSGAPPLLAVAGQGRHCSGQRRHAGAGKIKADILAAVDITGSQSGARCRPQCTSACCNARPRCPSDRIASSAASLFDARRRQQASDAGDGRHHLRAPVHQQRRQAQDRHPHRQLPLPRQLMFDPSTAATLCSGS